MAQGVGEIGRYEDLSQKIIAACIEVHRCLGPGRLLPIHEAQVLTYLKLTGFDVGLLINFNVSLLRSGIRRLSKKDSSQTPRLPVPAL